MADVVLAECPWCHSFTVSPPPEQESCEECRRTVWPVPRLVRHTFPAGCRIDVSGAVFAPDGSLLFEERKHTEAPDGDVARMRKILADYDSGKLHENEIEGWGFRRAVETIVAVMKAGEEILTFSSWCSREVPPKDTVRAEITIDAQTIEVRPLP